MTMPVSREDMVSSKYIMLILLTLIGTVFSSAITIGINVVLKSDNLFTTIINSFIGAFIVMSSISAFMKEAVIFVIPNFRRDIP